MNIKFYINGKKPINKLYVRVYHSGLDVCAFTGLFVDVNWDEDSQSLANSSDFNIKLSQLKTDILTDLNKAFSSGDIINRSWLETAVKQSFDRPKHEVGFKNKFHEIYLTEFANYWLENFADKWKVSPRKFMGKKLKGQYQKVADDLREFEGFRNDKIALKDINGELLDEIIVWLEDLSYSPSTIERFIKRIKFICARAKQLGYSVNENYNDKVFIETNENNIVVPVLSLDEITAIYELDFSHDEEMDNIRDLFIIQLFSGVRISDMMNSISTENIKNGFIELKTSKTGAWVSIPCHQFTKNILDKRFGCLPKKVAENEYNRQIKIICQLAGINEMIYGKKFDSDKNRKIAKYYPKHELITSHSARRSLLTMLKDKVSDQAIKSMFGWTKGSEMLNLYNKKTAQDYAVEIKNFWENKQ